MTESQEVHYSNDRDWLLGQAALLSNCSFEVPAQALEEVIRFLGYSQELAWGVPEKLLAYTALDRRTVVVAKDLAQRLDYPESAPGVLRSSLAYEIGHIRLHAERMLKGIFRKTWHREANEYAMVFLMPRERVLARAEVGLLQSGQAKTQEELWGLVAELAGAFQVTRAFMARALVAYEVIRMNRQTRKIKACVLPKLADSSVAA